MEEIWVKIAEEKDKENKEGMETCGGLVFERWEVK